MADLRLPRMNKIFISGRITQDIDLKYTPKGTPVVRFTIASDRSYKDDSGNFQQSTTFIDVVAWSKLAESVSSQTHKGSALLVEGRLDSRSYTDSNNVNRKVVEIVADHIHFLEWKAKAGSENENDSNPPLPEEEMPHPQVTNDDVPF